MNRTFGIPEALQSLKPGAQWALSGDDYTGLEWLDTEQTQPTEQECATEAARLQAEYDALEYQRLRAPEYPAITDYLDGIAKGDKAQVDAYIAACQAVKAKYPKPE
jgi:anti-sigma factor RsiW